MTTLELNIVTKLLINPMPLPELIDHLWDEANAENNRESEIYKALAASVSLDALANGFAK